MQSGISIIIPSLNEEHYIANLLTSLAKQKYPLYEVIVVDGQSKDQTLIVAKSFQNKIKNFKVVESTRGVSHQRNIGAQKATHPILVFLDADTVVPTDFLLKVSRKIKSKEQKIILPLILPHNGSAGDYIFSFISYVFFFLVKPFKPIITGMCIITTKNVHTKINGFNEKAVYGEDMDYGLRAVGKGATYDLNLAISVRASTRRKTKIRKRWLGFMWLQWYKDIILSGAITDEKRYNYELGSHDKERG